MKRVTTTTYILLAIVMIFLQVTIFSNISLWGCATPFVFIYFLLKLPISLSPNKVMTISFLTGLIIDIFFSTPGMYALSSVVLAFFRKPFITLVLQHEDDYGTMIPSMRTLGTAPFMVYVLISSFTFSLIIHTIQSFSLYAPLHLFLKIFAGTLITFITLVATEYILKERR